MSKTDRLNVIYATVLVICGTLLSVQYIISLGTEPELMYAIWSTLAFMWADMKWRG